MHSCEARCETLLASRSKFRRRNLTLPSKRPSAWYSTVPMKSPARALSSMSGGMLMSASVPYVFSILLFAQYKSCVLQQTEQWRAQHPMTLASPSTHESVTRFVIIPLAISHPVTKSTVSARDTVLSNSTGQISLTGSGDNSESDCCMAIGMAVFCGAGLESGKSIDCGSASVEATKLVGQKSFSLTLR